MKTGLERLLNEAPDRLKGVDIGLLTNQSAIDSRLEHATTQLIKAGNVVKCFAPEHGLYGIAQDQIGIDERKDPLTDLPCVSLYGQTETSLSPTQESLSDIDLLVFDIQDVGVRYYTFVYTLALAMKACQIAGKRVMVLDRPNPINGITMEGNVLDVDHRSFVGLYPIPVRHGMTVGELALLFNSAFEIGCDLEVIPMTGWQRKMWFDETHLPWAQPSPNMPTIDTSTVYAGSCLLEGTNLSEGRGTTRPFEIIGAPWIHPADFAHELNLAALPGVHFRPLFFQPTFHKWQGKTCGGVQIHVTNRHLFRSFATGLWIVQTAHRLYPNDFAWRTQPYEFGDKRLAFDMLCGTTKIREMIESGQSLDTIESSWQIELKAFFKTRELFLLYES